MSSFNTDLKLTYDDNYGVRCLYLKFTYNDDGTATLTNPNCENRVIILDRCVVRYLKEIEPEVSKYYFKFIGNRWFINHLSNIYKFSPISELFLSGDKKDDGKTITCFNPILM